jgi:hypothetical protein
MQTSSHPSHEHCHSKLSLLLRVANPALPVDSVYVSPFKNAPRNLEAVLHTVYPISMECAFRLALLDRYAGSNRERALAVPAAMTFRLRVVLDTLALETAKDSARGAIVASIRAFAADVVSAVSDEMQRCPPAVRRAHERERQRVVDRHAWDIGQALARGIAVKDGGLSDVDVVRGRARFRFMGRRYEANAATPKPHRGGYGSHLHARTARHAIAP